MPAECLGHPSLFVRGNLESRPSEHPSTPISLLLSASPAVGRGALPSRDPPGPWHAQKASSWPHRPFLLLSQQSPNFVPVWRSLLPGRQATRGIFPSPPTASSFVASLPSAGEFLDLSISAFSNCTAWTIKCDLQVI